MSEYQYYEFQALDKPLDEGALRYLRALSSRASITPTSFVNVYNYGGFRGNPQTLMEKYFDAFVYVSSWGAYELMFRFPRKAVDVKALASYCVDDYLSLLTKGRSVILHFSAEEEGADWVDGEGCLAALTPLRNDILNGDLRSLYIGWLACVQVSAPDEARLEPTVPPGLGQLSGPNRALAEFLGIDDSLVQAAALRSTELRPTATKARLCDWIRSLPATNKDSLLLELMRSDAPRQLQAKLLKQFRDEAAPEDGPQPTDRRTVAELLAAAQEITTRKRIQASARAERQRKQRERKHELVREKRLDKLAVRQAAAWREVEELICSLMPKNYAEAVRILQDLHALADRQQKRKQYDKRLADLRKRHGRKRNFMANLNRAGL